MIYITKKDEKHAAHIIVLLLIALLGGSVAIGMFVKSNYYVYLIDAYFYNLMSNSTHPEWLNLLISPFNFNFLPAYLSPLRMPSYFYPMVLGTLIYLWFRKRNLFWWAVFCFSLGTIISLVVTAINWNYVFRERPFLTLPSPVDDFGRMAWGKLSSYPSGHARETALYSTIIAAFIPRLKWVALGFVIFIAFSRVYIGAHYPTDAIAGALIGFMTAVIVLLIARELQLIIRKRKGSKNEEKSKKQNN